MHYAALGGQKDIIEFFLSKGVNVNITDYHGRIPLHHAVSWEYRDTVQYLLERDADINAKDQWGTFPIHYAAFAKDSEIFDLLVAKGAEIDVTNNDGATTLHYAVRVGSQNIVEHSVQEGMDVNAIDGFGWKAADDPDYVYMVGPRGKIKIGDIEVYTINDHHDGVPEVAYLVKADGVVMYHSGNYVGRLDSFRDDISYFAGKYSRVDLLFTFLIGNTSKYAIQRLKPVSAFPMHAFGMEYFYQGAALNLGKANPRTKIICGEFQGDRFISHKGKISR